MAAFGVPRLDLASKLLHLGDDIDTRPVRSTGAAISSWEARSAGARGDNAPASRIGVTPRLASRTELCGSASTVGVAQKFRYTPSRGLVDDLMSLAHQLGVRCADRSEQRVLDGACPAVPPSDRHTGRSRPPSALSESAQSTTSSLSSRSAVVHLPAPGQQRRTELAAHHQLRVQRLPMQGVLDAVLQAGARYDACRAWLPAVERRLRVVWGVSLVEVRVSPAPPELCAVVRCPPVPAARQLLTASMAGVAHAPEAVRAELLPDPDHWGVPDPRRPDCVQFAFAIAAQPLLGAPAGPGPAPAPSAPSAVQPPAAHDVPAWVPVHPRGFLTAQRVRV